MNLLNLPLVTSLVSIGLAQGLKVPLHYISNRKINLKLVTSTGGMPSSHSAAVTGLATAVGFQEGLTSSVFAVAMVFAIITMFDATGVRRQTGEHSIILNNILDYFRILGESGKGVTLKHGNEKLKEMLGHKPIEVFFGGLLGVATAFFIYYLYK